MVFERITPEEFRAGVAPLIGEGAAADVAGAHQAMSAAPGRSIVPETSAQKLLGVTPLDPWVSGWPTSVSDGATSPNRVAPTHGDPTPRDSRAQR